MDGVTYLTVKAVSRDGERIIEGWATTPDLDRVGDSIDPKGAIYKLPLPLLFSHDHSLPIGSVFWAEVTRAGIRIKARLTKGVAKADEVWRLIKDGALNAVSVGFRALDSKPIGKGRVFTQWDWYELSVCAVPCNANARISIGKSMVYAMGGPAKNIAGPLVGSIAGIESKAVTWKHFVAVAEVMSGEIKALKNRLSEIEAKGVVYRGLFNASEDYKRGDLVTWGGSIFHATRNTQGITPQHSEGQKPLDHPWQLAVRKGRDASNRNNGD